jgi:hypothetical protein
MIIRSATIVILTVLLTDTTQAKLIHRYSFNDGTAKDSAGIVDGKLFGSAKISGGQLVLDNDKMNSDAAQLQYLEFTAPILPESGSVTLVAWFTAKKDSGEFARLINIGDHENGEGRAFIYVTPHTTGDQSRAATSATDTQGRIFVDNKRLDDDEEHMIAVVIDGAAGKLHVFVDGKEGSAAEDLGENTLDKVRQVDRWLGRSSFDRDAGFCGSINEFRVYDHAMSADEVSAAYDVGADALPAAQNSSTAPATKK